MRTLFSVILDPINQSQPVRRKSPMMASKAINLKPKLTSAVSIVQGARGSTAGKYQNHHCLSLLSEFQNDVVIGDNLTAASPSTTTLNANALFRSTSTVNEFNEQQDEEWKSSNPVLQLQFQHVVVFTISVNRNHQCSTDYKAEKEIQEAIPWREQRHHRRDEVRCHETP